MPTISTLLARRDINNSCTASHPSSLSSGARPKLSVPPLWCSEERHCAPVVAWFRNLSGNLGQFGIYLESYGNLESLWRDKLWRNRRELSRKENECTLFLKVFFFSLIFYNILWNKWKLWKWKKSVKTCIDTLYCKLITITDTRGQPSFLVTTLILSLQQTRLGVWKVSLW